MSVVFQDVTIWGQEIIACCHWVATHVSVMIAALEAIAENVPSIKLDNKS
jgi:hypothetical protein